MVVLFQPMRNIGYPYLYRMLRSFLQYSNTTALSTGRKPDEVARAVIAYGREIDVPDVAAAADMLERSEWES